MRDATAMSPAPAHPARLVGSAWTRGDDAWRYCHWEVVTRDGDDVVVCATLDRARTHRLPWRALRDRAVWTPGWRSVVVA